MNFTTEYAQKTPDHVDVAIFRASQTVNLAK